MPEMQLTAKKVVIEEFSICSEATPHHAEIQFADGEFQVCDFHGVSCNRWTIKDWEFIGKLASFILSQHTPRKEQPKEAEQGSVLP